MEHISECRRCKEIFMVEEREDICPDCLDKDIAFALFCRSNKSLEGKDVKYDSLKGLKK